MNKIDFVKWLFNVKEWNPVTKFFIGIYAAGIIVGLITQDWTYGAIVLLSLLVGGGIYEIVSSQYATFKKEVEESK